MQFGAFRRLAVVAVCIAVSSLVSSVAGAQGVAARSDSLPLVGNYLAVTGPLHPIQLIGSSDSSFAASATQEHGIYRLVVQVSSVGDQSGYGELTFASTTPLHVGSFPLVDPYAYDPPFAFDLSFDSSDLDHSVGVVRILQLNLNRRTGGVQLAATFAIRASGTTTPTYGAIGVDTTTPMAVPGETAKSPLGDFDGDGRTDLAVWRPSTGQWWIRGHAPITYGRRGDIPVPGDYNGDGRTDLAVWRPSTGQWWIRSHAPVTYGRRGDQPAQSDYNGDGSTDIAVLDPAARKTYIRGQQSIALGRAGDRAVPAFYPYYGENAPYFNDGRSIAAIWRPSTGAWLIQDDADFRFGRRGDIPVPGSWHPGEPNDYLDAPAVFRPTTGTWYIDSPYGEVAVNYGRDGDKPV